MPARKELSPEELQEIISRRQRGSSWLGIQNETGIGRRIAQREYLAWDKEQGREMLADVRKEIAAKAFQSHLDLLVEIAAELAALLASPGSQETREADRLIEDGIRDGIRYRPTGEDSQLMHISQRQRWWLYQVLQVHTRESVPWTSLDDWKTQWGRCIRMKEELRVVLSRKVDKWLIEAEQEGLGSELWSQIWLRLIDSRPRVPSDADLMAIMAPGRSYSQRIEEAAKQLGMLVDDALAINLVDQITLALGKMRRDALDIDEALDPLRLSPALLWTRCDLCPA